MLLNLIVCLFYWINLFICSTLKYKVINEPRGQALFALWHGETFPLFYWAQHRKLCLYPTEIWRGETIAHLAKKYGYKTIRFKEKGTPLEKGGSLLQFMQIISSGYDAAIAVDGPPKPLIFHKAKPGIFYLSRKTGVPIVPAGIRMKRKIVLIFRWDRYEIPLPWSEVEINFGQSFVANEKTTTQELEKLLLGPCQGSQSAAN